MYGTSRLFHSFWAEPNIRLDNIGRERRLPTGAQLKHGESTGTLRPPGLLYNGAKPHQPHPIPHPNSVNPDTTPEHYNNSRGAQGEQTKSPSQSRRNIYTYHTPPNPVYNQVPLRGNNSAISQDGQPQTLSQTTGEPSSPTVTDPFTNSPISQVGLSQSPLGPWRVPTNPHHHYSIACKSWYRLKPLNNRPGL